MQDGGSPLKGSSLAGWHLVGQAEWRMQNGALSGRAELVPELIYNRSGAGSQITAVDLNHDGRIHILNFDRQRNLHFLG